jgi:dolichol-phosphate mannosyltransferase
MIKTAIVIPTYNEAENLPILVDSLRGLGIDGLHILIVDDNSPDGTGEIADGIKENNPSQISVIHRAGKLGLGTAYITGFKYCLEHGAERIVQMDADFSHNPEKVKLLLEGLNDYDMVLGSRYVQGGSLDEDWAYWRKALSAFGNLYTRLIIRTNVRDITGGFRAWRKQTLEGIPLDRVKSQGYAFQIEMAYITSLMGFSIYEIPIYFAERTRGDSKMSLRIQLEAALRVWSILIEYRDLRRQKRKRKQNL